MESLIFILYILLVITLVRTLLSILRSSKPSPRLPPGPMPLPVIGSLLKLGDKPHKSLAELAKLYGPIMSLKLGRKTVVVVSSPALAREVLQKQDLAFPTRSVPKAIHAHGHNKYSVAWLPVADQWRSLRKALNSNIFSGKLDPPTPISKRKRAAPSPTSSANSVIGENSVQVLLRIPQTMSTSGNEPHEHEHEREHEHESSDDDLMDLEMLSMSSEDEVNKIPQRTFLVGGETYTQFLMTQHPTTIKDLLRVDKQTFKSLVSLLVDKGELKWDHMRLSVEESLAMFLYICGHNERHRVVGHWFQHSTDTISKHFKRMRRALCNLAPIIIQPPNLDVTPSEILNDQRYYPYFQDCIGAIDGTHIDAWVPSNREIAYRGRKATKTQNVMAVCSFDMKFTFVYPGWEGSAHDGRVFMAAVSNPAYNFPHPPINKYYVVDSGYTNMPGYLAPYRGQRYHPDEWNGVNTVFQSRQELFNYKHASLRNVIERCFGVLKARFPILKSMPKYPPARQPQIVTACCVIHNWILMERGKDEFFDDFSSDEDSDEDEDADGEQGNVEQINMSAENLALMATRRNEIAQMMWETY